MVRRTIAILLVALFVGAACGGDDSSSADSSTTTSTTEPVVMPLSILVTNDDGIGAPGIDVIVNALQEVESVEVAVVAPAENQSGTSDTTTEGGASYEEGVTASGVAGIAVDGYPADSVDVALDDIGLSPDLVVSGINSGQNVGPLAYASGTVGAARTAARRGLPAVAASAGFAENADFDLAAQLVIDWISEHRDALTGGEVVSINVPQCTAGEPKDPVEVPLATEIPEGVDPFNSDCSIDPGEGPADDVLAVAEGYPSITDVPLEAPPG